MKRVLSVFKRLDRVVKRDVDPTFSVGLARGPDAHFPEPRNMAYTMYDSDTDALCIVVSNKLVNGADSRIEGVMMHEFGHAVLLWQNIHHTERDADAVAEKMFGKKIFYDKQTVQSTRGGKRPRPLHLGR